MSKTTIHEQGKDQYTRDMTSEEEAQLATDIAAIYGILSDLAE